MGGSRSLEWTKVFERYPREFIRVRNEGHKKYGWMKLEKCVGETDETKTNGSVLESFVQRGVVNGWK